MLGFVKLGALPVDAKPINPRIPMFLVGG